MIRITKNSGTLNGYRLYLNEHLRQASIIEINNNMCLFYIDEHPRQTITIFKINKNLCTMLNYYFFFFCLNGQPRQARIFELSKNMSMISCFPFCSNKHLTQVNISRINKNLHKLDSTLMCMLHYSCCDDF